jgi:hypothetical protein
MGECNYSTVFILQLVAAQRFVEFDSEKQRQFVESFPYPAIVGSLLYLAIVTRPDIMFAVEVLTHHLKSSTYKAACRVINYLSHHPALLSLYVIQERRSIYMSTPTPTGLVTETRGAQPQEVS